MSFHRSDLHSALDGAGILEVPGYKHFAPPEQEPQNNKKNFLCKASHEASEAASTLRVTPVRINRH